MYFSQALGLLGLAAIASAVSDPSSGCGQPPPVGQDVGGPSQRFTIDVYGTPRHYLLHLPQNYNPNKPHPLYFSFHGALRNASEQEALSSFSDPKFNPHGIAVYPNATHERWLSNPNARLNFPNDLDFVYRLLGHIESVTCVDRNAIYAVGKSNGGAFTSVIACNTTLSPRFAAFASVSGAYYNDSESVSPPAFVGRCKPGTLFTPFFEFHGLNDTVAPYHGKHNTSLSPRFQEPGVPYFLDSWAQLNGCPAGTPAQSNESLFQGNVTHESWTCNGRAGIVQHYREDNLGHVWPSTFINDDCVHFKSQCPKNQTYLFNATSVMLDFWSKNTKPDSRSGSATSQVSSSSEL